MLALSRAHAEKKLLNFSKVIEEDNLISIGAISFK